MYKFLFSVFLISIVFSTICRGQTNQNTSGYIGPIIYVGQGFDLINKSRTDFLSIRGITGSAAIGRINIDAEAYQYRVVNPNQQIKYLYDNQSRLPYSRVIYSYQNGSDLQYLHSEALITYNSTDNFSLSVGRGRPSEFSQHAGLIFDGTHQPIGYGQLNYEGSRFGLRSIYGRPNDTGRPSSGEYEAKLPSSFMFHELYYRPIDGLTLYLKEVVIFDRDSLDLAIGEAGRYLNPFVVYKALDRERGSPDNVIMSAGFEWESASGNSIVHATGLIDESVTNNSRYSWNSKWGGRISIYHRAMLYGDAREMYVRFTTVRPFTYSHSNSYTSWNSGGHSMGPILGAGFRKLDVTLSTSLKSGSIALYGSYSFSSRCTTGNCGIDVRKSYNSRSGVDIYKIGRPYYDSFLTGSLTYHTSLFNNDRLLFGCVISIDSIITKDFDGRTSGSYIYPSIFFSYNFDWKRNFPFYTYSSER